MWPWSQDHTAGGSKPPADHCGWCQWRSETQRAGRCSAQGGQEVASRAREWAGCRLSSAEAAAA